MRGLSGPSSVSGLVTTMDVRGVTKLYCSDISRALAVALVFSSGVPVLLWEWKNTHQLPHWTFSWDQCEIIISEVEHFRVWVKSLKLTSAPVAAGWWGRPTGALWNHQRCTPHRGTSHPTPEHWPGPAPGSPPQTFGERKEETMGIMQETICKQIPSYFHPCPRFVLILLVPIDFSDSPMFSYFCSSLR